ncbi:MAG: sensor histidine kinase [Planctomycetota bacterium]
MTLRRRLGLTLLLTAIPLAGGLLLLRAHEERRSLEREVREFVLGAMETGGRQLCEAFPTAFPAGPDLMEIIQQPMPIPLPPGIEPPPLPAGLDLESLAGAARDQRPPLWAYHADFHSSNAAAPPFPASLREALEAGGDTASAYVEVDGERVIRVAVRMPWDTGPCAIVIADRPLQGREREAGVVFWGLVVLCCGLLSSVLLTTGPIVRRIRRLQRGVRHAAATHYASEIEVRGSDEVADLAADFNAAGQEVRKHLADLEAREQTLRSFVANTTHDVMIPLTVLQGHLKAIEERVEKGEGVEPEDVRASLEEAHYMGSLVHNLNAAAKLEAGTVTLTSEPVNLDELVGRVVGRHRPIARLRGIRLDYTVPEEAVFTTGDVTLLEQAVGNVVHNAVRYNEDGGHVSVLLERIDDDFRIRVLDDGPGVSEADLARLTEPRFREEAARSRDPTGLGLGLHIAKDVADRHGFSLTFRPGEERGLEVEFRGPVHRDGTGSHGE